MPLPEFKLREAWRGSSAGCEIPKFVIDGGRGGRFDATLAEQYALRCSTLSKTASLRKEGPRLLAQFKATRSVPEGERVRYNKFLVTTLRAVEGFIERSRRRIVADSEERNEVFSRYAAFLNFIEVQSGRRFSLAKYQKYRDEFGLDDGASETEPEQGYLEAEIDRFLKELGQDVDIQDLEHSSRRFA